MDILSDVNVAGNLNVSKNIKIFYSTECGEYSTLYDHNGFMIIGDSHTLEFCSTGDDFEISSVPEGNPGSFRSFKMFELYDYVCTLVCTLPHVIQTEIDKTAPILFNNIVPSGCKEFFIDGNNQSIICSFQNHPFPLIVAYNSITGKKVEMDDSRINCNDKMRITASIADDSGGDFTFKII